MGLTIGGALAGAGTSLGQGIRRSGQYRYSAEEEKRKRIQSDVANILGMVGKAPIEQLRPFLRQARGYQDIDYEGLDGVIGRFDAAERADDAAQKRLDFRLKYDLLPGETAEDAIVAKREEKKAKADAAKRGEARSLESLGISKKRLGLSIESAKRSKEADITKAEKAKKAEVKAEFKHWHDKMIAEFDSSVLAVYQEIKGFEGAINMLMKKKTSLTDDEKVMLNDAQLQHSSASNYVREMEQELRRRRNYPTMSVQKLVQYLENLEVPEEMIKRWSGLFISSQDNKRSTDFDSSVPYGPQLPSSTNIGIPDKYNKIVHKYSTQYGVDKHLIANLIKAESGWKSDATSWVGAQGLMQLMPKTADLLGVKDAYDVDQNIMGGVKYLSQLLKMYDGDVFKTLWAYNAGPGNVRKNVLPDETKDYILKIMKGL